MIDKSSKNLLIIEDDEDIMDCYIAVLANEFSWKNLYTANCAGDAKHILKVHEIDIVVSDFKLPDFDGIELLKKLHQKGQKIPKYIFITGFDSAKFRRDAMSLGAVTILKKPFDDLVIKQLKERLSIA